MELSVLYFFFFCRSSNSNLYYFVLVIIKYFERFYDPLDRSPRISFLFSSRCLRSDKSLYQRVVRTLSLSAGKLAILNRFFLPKVETLFGEQAAVVTAGERGTQNSRRPQGLGSRGRGMGPQGFGNLGEICTRVDSQRCGPAEKSQDL